MRGLVRLVCGCGYRVFLVPKFGYLFNLSIHLFKDFICYFNLTEGL